MLNKPLLVRDYMHETISIREEGATFTDVIQLMISRKRNGVFVVDQDNKVKGVISAWDLIEHVVPDYLESDKHLAPFESENVLIDRVRAVANDPIDRFMTKNVHTVHEGSPIIEAATMLSEHRLRQLPVVRDDGALMGCINRTDIKLIFAEILNLNLS
ncbi:CBS domain-containing protein [Candidatus Uhrbacteria bacterium]|nr:CBS domain-containing protein [Candidatus Uhrbacteria bacterium]